MEQLDSVNVFIFPILKFKKWNLSLTPGCTLSCLKKSDYLLRVCCAALGGFYHKLITKSRKATIHQNLMVLVLMKNFTEKNTCDENQFLHRTPH